MGLMTKDDCYLFNNGIHYTIYEKMGAHLTTVNGKKGTNFVVWAPNAETVSVVGDFNNWSGFEHNMEKLGETGIWELFVPGIVEGEIYKYVIVSKDGTVHYKADPYAFSSEVRPANASKIAEIDGFKWTDKKWISDKSKKNNLEEPMSIYEVHLGSWKKDYSFNEDGFIDYKRLAHELAEYIKEMGYTHVELMGIAEHPFDGSWGYQVTGYYAPTSRYGSPKDFMYFVDYMHKNGIGVILDWVPAHFPRDEHGLAMFDGTPTYEYADTRKGEHPDWGTKVFDYSKTEVSNFLIANALFWLEKYHIDGLRVDAVASMLYLDYGRENGQWCPNIYGDNKNLEAIEFFKHLNSIVKKRVGHAFVIAEESTAWPKVTKAPEEDGLGFTYKWNMGWMHDFLEYMKLDPYFRKFNHNKMTFGMTYAFSENFILVLSHDEVVHLKCSMINKMPGYESDKFSNLKTGYTFMFGHPGRKLLFMGQDFAQLSEWSEARSLDWHLVNEEPHKDMQEYVKKLLHIYKQYPALYSDVKEYESFEWINCDDADRSILSFVRKNSSDYKKALLFVCNFTPVERGDYMVGVPKKGTYKKILSSVDGDKTCSLKAVEGECDDRQYHLQFELKPFESVIIEFPIVREKTNNEKSK